MATTIKQNPFSLYDFLGYFVPGTLMSYILMLCIIIHRTKKKLGDVGFSEELYSLFADFHNSGYIVPFILFSYCLGHLVSALSAIFVEEYYKIFYGYPSRGDFQDSCH